MSDPALPAPTPSPGPAPPSASVLQRAARAVRLARARRDFAAFCELVLKDESTGVPVRLSSMHRRWADLLQHKDRVLLLSHIESGKSAIISVGWVLFRLGQDPSLRCALVSNTASQAQKLLRSVARHIERNTELRAVWPELKPGSPWNESSITVERGTVSKDPSVSALGLHGALLGSRVDLLVVDDLLDFESSRTAAGRDTAHSWLVSTAFSRTTARSQIVCAATPWHKEDTFARLEAQGWYTSRHPVEVDGEPSWPERWPEARIARKRLELGPAQSARQLDVVCRSDDTAAIAEGSIALALKRGSSEATRLRTNAAGEVFWLSRPVWPARILCGLDPSLGASGRSDLSALVTVYLRPDGSREILEVQSGRWSGPEILARVDSVHQRFNPARIVVEGNGGQSFLLHFAKERGAHLPLEAFTTGKGSKSLPWLAERFATELHAGKWLIPSIDGVPATAELRALVRDLLSYSPADHTPDRLAALLLASTAIASSGQRAGWLRIPDLMAR